MPDSNYSSQVGGGMAGKFASQPIAVWFGAVVLAALLLLAVLRHLFGSIRVEVGTR